MPRPLAINEIYSLGMVEIDKSRLSYQYHVKNNNFVKRKKKIYLFHQQC